LLDGMEIADLREAVAMTDVQALLEASRGVTLESLAAIGVDLISVSALTAPRPHSTSASTSNPRKLVRTSRHTALIVNDRCHKGTEIWHIGPNSAPLTAFRCTYCHRGLR
jgi:hypothetical protein